MRITISGRPGSGKSTIGKLLAQKRGYKRYSTGDYMRKLAQEENMDIYEFSKKAELTDEIDKKLDDWQKSLNQEDNFILDARLGYHFIQDCIKIYLDVSEKEAARRIASRENEDFEKILKLTQRRIKSEKKRYKELYGLNYEDVSQYDLVIDTDKYEPKEILTIVETFISKT